MSDLFQLTHNILTENMVFVIMFFAVIELFLIWKIYQGCAKQNENLFDSSVNLTNGLVDVPDSITSQSHHDKIYSLINYISRKIEEGGDEQVTLRRNAARQLQNNSLNDTYPIESRYNLCSALVQIFPLLGILGTILALSQVGVDESGSLRASDVTTAFVIAIDTTILGIFFAIIFTFFDANIQARVRRTLDDSKRLSGIISSLVV